MTLTAEMSRLNLVFAGSRSKRQAEIGRMKTALNRQIKDGRASAKLTSTTLFDAIERVLKAISRDVAANRKATSSLIGAFSTGRHAEAKLLRAKLDAERKHVTVAVKNIIDGLKHNRVGAGQVVRSWAEARKNKVAPAKTAAPAVVAKSDAAKMATAPASTHVAKADVPAMPSSSAEARKNKVAPAKTAAPAVVAKSDAAKMATAPASTHVAKADVPAMPSSSAAPSSRPAANKPTGKAAVSLAPSFGAAKVTPTPPAAHFLANPITAPQSTAAKTSGNATQRNSPAPNSQPINNPAPSFGAREATATPPITSAAKPGDTKE